MSEDIDKDLYPLANDSFPTASFCKMLEQYNMFDDDDDDSYESTSRRQSYKSNYKPRNPQRIEELTKYELECLEKKRYWKNFYKKHPVLHFLRETVVPKPYYHDGPSYLNKFL